MSEIGSLYHKGCMRVSQRVKESERERELDRERKFVSERACIYVCTYK